MNEPPIKSPPGEPDPNADGERTKQVTVAGWTAGISAVLALTTLEGNPSWPAAFGVAVVMAMVAVVCHFILKKEK